MPNALFCTIQEPTRYVIASRAERRLGGAFVPARLSRSAPMIFGMVRQRCRLELGAVTRKPWMFWAGLLTSRPSALCVPRVRRLVPGPTAGAMMDLVGPCRR